MRISRYQMFMDIAEVAARRATCWRGNSGALVVKDRDIVSIGYNGPPSGEPHCSGNDCPRGEDGGCIRSIHSEANAIIRAQKKLGTLRSCSLYSLWSPCFQCAKLIISAEIHSVYYRYPYRDSSGIRHLIETKRASVYKVLPAGWLIDERTGLLIEYAA